MRLSFLLLAFCIGIYGAATVPLPLCYTGAAAVVCIAAACRSRRSYYLYAALFFLGLFRTECRYSLRPDLPARVALYALSVDDNDRSARLTAWRDDAGAWHGTDLRVRLYGADNAAAGQASEIAGPTTGIAEQTTEVAERTSGIAGQKSGIAERATGIAGQATEIAEQKSGIAGLTTGIAEQTTRVAKPTTEIAGQTLVVAARFRRFDPERSHYARRMRRHGYAGSLRIYPDAIIVRTDDSLAVRTLHTAAVERVRRIPLSPDARALVTALATGERSAFRPALREAYIRSGNAHLLAVSGLHIGIFYLLADTLSALLLLFFRGNRLRDFAVAAAVWLYVAATGFPVSAVRAALMFTLYLSMRRAGGRNDSGRILSVTALTMLAIDPLWLYDIGFQLSFLAMAGILLWGVPLGRRLRCRWRVVNRFTGLSAVAVTATLATAPLVAHYFGRVSFLSPLLAVPTLLLSTAILALALTAMLLPCTHPVTASLLERLATLQNHLVTRVSALPAACPDLQFSTTQTLGFYLMFLSATLLLYRSTDTDRY